MNNSNLEIKFYKKSELAKLAHVSYSTFYRYLKTHRTAFEAMNISIYAKKLPYQAVKLLSEGYCIDL